MSLGPKWKAVLKMLLWIVIGFLMLSAYAVSSTAGDSSKGTTYGNPRVYVDKDELSRKSIDQIVDDGERIYLLLDDHQGVVQVYSIDGEYQNSIAFYKHINGAFRIAVQDGIFYVCDKEGSLYLFSCGEFIEFIDYQSGAALRKSIDFESASTKYTIQAGSVWKISGDERICVISRPLTAMLYQDHLMVFLGLSAIMFFGILRALKKRQ